MLTESNEYHIHGENLETVHNKYTRNVETDWLMCLYQRCGLFSICQSIFFALSKKEIIINDERYTYSSQFFNILFFGYTGSPLLHRLFSSYGEPGLLSSCGVRGFSLRWLLLLPSTGSRVCGLQQLWHLGSVGWLIGSREQGQQLWCTGLVAVTCGIFPDQESNQCLLHWQVDSLPVNHQGSPSGQFFFFFFFLLFSVYLGFPHVFTWIVKKSQALLQEEEEESEAAFSLGSYVLIFVDRQWLEAMQNTVETPNCSPTQLLRDCDFMTKLVSFASNTCRVIQSLMRAIPKKNNLAQNNLLDIGQNIQYIGNYANPFTWTG